MRFYHCSQNSYSIPRITLRQLPLRSSTKATLFGILNKQKPFTISGLELFCEIACLKKNFNIHRKTGTDLENFERGALRILYRVETT